MPQLIVAAAFLLGAWPLPALSEAAWQATFDRAIRDRQAGNLHTAIEALDALRASAPSPAHRVRASGELGAAHAQARRSREAREALLEAHAQSAGIERARHAIELGNVSLREGDKEEARRRYREASELGVRHSTEGLTAALNLARLEGAEERLARMREVRPLLAGIGDAGQRARLELNLGEQARELGPDALELARSALESAVRQAQLASDARLEIEALDALAQLHEDQHDPAEARRLTLAAAARSGWVHHDLRFGLDWRLARLHDAAGEADRSLAAYERAVAALETIRSDIPIQYDDGRSSFRATFEPLYLGLADQLLRKAARVEAGAQAPYLMRARDVVELLKQAEMQDYLGDRCEVEAIHKGGDRTVGEGVAILYPIILRDRTELLLETAGGIAWRTTRVSAVVLRTTARSFASALRSGRPGFFDADARHLFDWLLRPFASELSAKGIRLLVVVPDSALRLVPIAALHDGERYVVESLATAVATGLTMVNSDPPARGRPSALVAGVATPGPAVEKLPPAVAAYIAGSGGVRSPQLLRERLALPGVAQEVAALSQALGAEPLLDEAFTVSAFEQQVRSGDYRIVHVASHGVFGSSAERSFVIAYDDLLTMRRLEALLRSERLRRYPIEILSLSACETAEGDDRSPLGISGVAMKARAKSVVGTLWPVEDQAARIAMQRFYEALTATGGGKAAAMREAQLQLLRSREYAQPFFWAPFVLIGNWL